MKITIDRQQLLAAALFTAKKDIRHYLNGVYVEATAVETRLTATTGQIIVFQRLTCSNDVENTVSLIVPSEILDSVKGITGPDLSLELIDNIWFLRDGASLRSFVPVESNFPEYRRVIATQVSNEAANYNPELLIIFVKAAKILGKSKMFLMQNGAAGAYVGITDNHDFVGVIMPIRSTSVKTHIDSWANDNMLQSKLNT